MVPADIFILLERFTPLWHKTVRLLCLLYFRERIAIIILLYIRMFFRMFLSDHLKIFQEYREVRRHGKMVYCHEESGF